MFIPELTLALAALVAAADTPGSGEAPSSEHPENGAGDAIAVGLSAGTGLLDSSSGCCGTRRLGLPFGRGQVIALNFLFEQQLSHRWWLGATAAWGGAGDGLDEPYGHLQVTSTWRRPAQRLLWLYGFVAAGLLVTPDNSQRSDGRRPHPAPAGAVGFGLDVMLGDSGLFIRVNVPTEVASVANGGGLVTPGVFLGARGGRLYLGGISSGRRKK